MEKRINQSIETYVTTFKDNIKHKILDLDFENKCSADSTAPEIKEKINDLLEYIYEYERLSFQKEDLIKRKRIKNTIPTLNRCNANRANGQQCTRRRKKDCEFCGTHSKGTPHGLVANDDDNQNTEENPRVEKRNEKVSVFTQDIRGIVYYIDNVGNVYKTEDILLKKNNPQIIAKYQQDNAGKYSIAEFLMNNA